MTFSLSNQKKITNKSAIRKAFKKSLFFLLVFLFVFSVTNIFFNTAIRQRPLEAGTCPAAESGQNVVFSPVILSVISPVASPVVTPVASSVISPFISFVILPVATLAAKDKGPDISAQAAIIIECDTGRILWEKNSSEQLFPASTTKIMTGIIAIEEVEDLYAKTRISKNASGFNNSFFPFRTGDEITIMDLLKASLMNSNNNATIALAEYISGSEEEFLKKMNAKAIEIGAYNTKYQNTNGLDSNFPEHKSTAKDLATLAGYCMKNELFRKIVSTKNDVISVSGKPVDIFNTDVLLFFDYIKGVKTGYTDNAGYCLVTFSQRQELKLISVVLNSTQGMRESDMLKMINWSNENYSWKKIVDSSQIYKELEIDNKIENNDYIYSTKVFTAAYPEKDFVELSNINDTIEIIDDISEKNTGRAKSNIPNLTIDLPVKSGQQIGNLKVGINGEEKQVMILRSGEEIGQQYMFRDLKVLLDYKLRNMVIFLISFYFLIFILIIVRNLFLREKSLI